MDSSPRVDDKALLLESLQSVNSTEASVVLCSKLMLNFVRNASVSDAAACVKMWSDEVRDAQPATRLALVYVANDVLQKGRMLKIDGFRAAFESALLVAFRRITKDSPQFASKLLRLCGVWKQRRIFDSKYTTRLRSALQIGRSPAGGSDSDSDDGSGKYDEDGIDDDDDDDDGAGGGYGALEGDTGLAFLFQAPSAASPKAASRVETTPRGGGAASESTEQPSSPSAASFAATAAGVSGDLGLVQNVVTLPPLLARAAQQEVRARAHREALAAAELDADIADGTRNLASLAATSSLEIDAITALRRQVGLATVHRSAAVQLLRGSKDTLVRLGKVLQTARAEQDSAIDQLTQQLRASKEIERGLSVLRKRHGVDAGPMRLRRKVGVRAAPRAVDVAVSPRSRKEGGSAAAEVAAVPKSKMVWNVMLRKYVEVHDQEGDEDSWRN